MIIDQEFSGRVVVENHTVNSLKNNKISGWTKFSYRCEIFAVSVSFRAFRFEIVAAKVSQRKLHCLSHNHRGTLAIAVAIIVAGKAEREARRTHL
jgi:hypothetical protein